MIKLRFHEKKQKFNCYGNQFAIKLLAQVFAREKCHKYKVKVIKSSFFSEFRNPICLQTKFKNQTKIQKKEKFI